MGDLGLRIFDLGRSRWSQFQRLDFRQRVQAHDALNAAVEAGRVAEHDFKLVLARPPLFCQRALLLFKLLLHGQESFNQRFEALPELQAGNLLLFRASNFAVNSPLICSRKRCETASESLISLWQFGRVMVRSFITFADDVKIFMR